MQRMRQTLNNRVTPKSNGKEGLSISGNVDFGNGLGLGVENGRNGTTGSLTILGSQQGTVDEDGNYEANGNFLGEISGQDIIDLNEARQAERDAAENERNPAKNAKNAADSKDAKDKKDGKDDDAKEVGGEEGPSGLVDLAFAGLGVVMSAGAAFLAGGGNTPTPSGSKTPNTGNTASGANAQTPARRKEDEDGKKVKDEGDATNEPPKKKDSKEDDPTLFAKMNGNINDPYLTPLSNENLFDNPSMSTDDLNSEEKAALKKFDKLGDVYKKGGIKAAEEYISKIKNVDGQEKTKHTIEQKEALESALKKIHKNQVLSGEPEAVKKKIAEIENIPKETKIKEELLKTYIKMKDGNSPGSLNPLHDKNVFLSGDTLLTAVGLDGKSLKVDANGKLIDESQKNKIRTFWEADTRKKLGIDTDEPLPTKLFKREIIISKDEDGNVKIQYPELSAKGVNAFKKEEITRLTKDLNSKTPETIKNRMNEKIRLARKELMAEKVKQMASEIGLDEHLMKAVIVKEINGKEEFGGMNKDGSVTIRVEPKKITESLDIPRYRDYDASTKELVKGFQKKIEPLFEEIGNGNKEKFKTSPDSELFLIHDIGETDNARAQTNEYKVLNELKLKAREHAESEVKKLDITKATENKYKEYKAKESEYLIARDNNTLPKEELTELNKERRRIKQEYQKLESTRQAEITNREDKLLEHIHRSTSATMGQLMGFNYKAAGKDSANQMFQDLQVAEKSTLESRQAGKDIPIEHPDRITVMNQQKDLIVTWLNSKLEASRKQALVSASNSLKNFTKADFDSPAKQDEINNVFRSIAENYNGKEKPQAVTMDYAEKVRKAYMESRFPKKQ